MEISALATAVAPAAPITIESMIVVWGATTNRGACQDSEYDSKKGFVEDPTSEACQDSNYDSKQGFAEDPTLEGLSWVPLVFTQTPIERVTSRMSRCSRD